MMNLLSDELRRSPFALYRELRANCPVFRDPRINMWMVFDYEGVKRALHDHDSFSSEVTPPTGKAPPWLVFSDPPRHTKLRALILRAFTPASIASLEPRMRELSRELLDPIVGRGEIDLVTEFAGPFPMLVIAEMLGIPAPDRPRFLRWSESIMNLSYSISGGAQAAQAISEHARVKQEIQEYLPALLASRRQSPQADLLTRLATAEVDGQRLSDDDILGFFQLLLAAGTETTTNLISNTILCLLEHPEERSRLAASPELLPSAIEEVLRYRSPGQMMFRETKCDVHMSGQTIPAGQFVLAMIGSANRDPAQFQDPERFDITRSPNPHIAFGHGIHFCLGSALARLESRVALTELLGRLRNFRPATDAPWEPRKALHIHGPTHLPLRFDPA